MAQTLTKSRTRKSTTRKSINKPVSTKLFVAAPLIAVPAKFASEKEWMAFGKKLAETERGLGWLIGEWWNAGERYGNRVKLARECGFNPKYCRDCGWLVEKIKVSDRSDTLGIRHHMEVAALDAPEQKKLLERADKESLSVKALRDEVKKYKEVASLPASQQKELLERADKESLSVKALKDEVKKIKNDLEEGDLEEEETSYLTLEVWNKLSKGKRIAALATKGDAKFNEQHNESVGWAKWTWNPITGCMHNCPYCYARDIANRFYPQEFIPTLHPDRLYAPQNTIIQPTDDMATRNVFTGSMADMFGKWVPEEWINAVMASVRRSPELNFLFLTKFPKRMIDRDVPNNVWLGTTIDKQSRVKTVEECFAKVPAHTRWLSLEPLLEPLRFSRPELFKWVVIGGASRSTQTPEWHPPFRWVVDVYRQFKEAGAAVYFKTNIGFEGETVSHEFPWQNEIDTVLPKEFNYQGNQ